MDLWRDPTYAAFWLDVARSDLAVWLQMTPYVYAALEGIHLVGVAFFFGAILFLDLRLLGLAPDLPVQAAGQFLLRLCAAGLLLLAVSGVLMFVPSADRYAVSPVFFMKMGLVAAGACNALAVHLTAWRDVEAWSRRARVPGAVRATAVASVLVWLGVIVLGRAMGYERRVPPQVDFELDWFGASDLGYGRQTPEAGGESIHSTGGSLAVKHTVSAAPFRSSTVWRAVREGGDRCDQEQTFCCLCAFPCCCRSLRRRKSAAASTPTT